MLSNVTWKEYLVALGVLLLLYYLLIGIKYYRKEIKNLLRGKRARPVFNIHSEQSSEEVSLEELEAVVFDLRYAILEKAGKNTSRQELLRQLSERLANYTGLRKPAYRVAINNAVIRYAKENCGIEFSEEELNETWERLSRR